MSPCPLEAATVATPFCNTPKTIQQQSPQSAGPPRQTSLWPPSGHHHRPQEFSRCFWHLVKLPSVGRNFLVAFFPSRGTASRHFPFHFGYKLCHFGCVQGDNTTFRIFFVFFYFFVCRTHSLRSYESNILLKFSNIFNQRMQSSNEAKIKNN